MASLREGIEKAQFQTPPQTSALGVAAQFGLQSPVSLLRVAQLLAPETVEWTTGSVVSGDEKLVSVDGHLQLTSTGFWTFSGTVTDGGEGASFAFIMMPKFTEPNKVLLFGEADSLDDDESTTFDKQGRDLWITRNWEAVRSNGFRWKLSASDSGAALEIFGSIVTGLIIAGAIFAGSKCSQQDGWTAQTGEAGEVGAVCNFS